MTRELVELGELGFSDYEKNIGIQSFPYAVTNRIGQIPQ